MTCTAKTTRDTFLTLTTITLMLCIGSNLAQAQQATVISGDLSSVDWRSLVGKEVVIEGDLVIVDTYDLARRGQIKVARSRLYVPTSHIDPNDKDPAATSFEGGNNVAKVVKAQKLNDKGTLTIVFGTGIALGLYLSRRTGFRQ